MWYIHTDEYHSATKKKIKHLIDASTLGHYVK